MARFFEIKLRNKEIGLITRRTFLGSAVKRSSLLALAPFVPSFLAQTARATESDRDKRILVVIQMDGGNDGFNTVVPFKDPGYAKYRKALRLRPDELVKVDDEIGLHPALAAAGRLLQSGRLAIVHGVGYPNPSRSHFESMDIWQTARLNGADRNGLGWIGRGLDEAKSVPGIPAAIFAGTGQMPLVLCGQHAVATSFSRPEDFVLAATAKPKKVVSNSKSNDDLAAFLQRSVVDGYAVSDHMAQLTNVKDGGGARYPATELAGRLKLLARLIKMDLGTRVFYTLQPGYDTHVTQPATHANLLEEWAGAVEAFLDDLKQAKLDGRVTVLTFSEFGRTVAENSSQGTDHGAAGPVMLAGPGVKAGLFGKPPRLLEQTMHGDVLMSIDFRQVYATLLEDWLGLPARSSLAGAFQKLPLFAG
jgi:uncharacterized protein (DUF1501 family)